MNEEVLLVDDDEIFRERLARALRARGYDVTTAAGYDDAIASATRRRPDFAIVDMRMPGPSGMEVVEALSALAPDAKIVVLTGYGSIASAVEALHKGACHYLSKPVDADEIVATLHRLEHADEAAPAVTSEATPSLARAEWEHISRVLGDCGGNVSEASRRLGITRRTLQLKLKKYPPRT